MNQKPMTRHVAFAAISLLPLLYLAFVWKDLPDMVPTHYDAHGNPNDYTRKSLMWLVTGGLCGVTLVCYFLLSFINKIDPKNVRKPVPVSMEKIAAVIVVFLTAVNILVLFSGLHPQEKLANRSLPVLTGLLLTFLGNYMHNVKPNYFVGFRLPWTLASEYNWKKTHKLAGIMWFAGGLVIAIVSLIAPYELSNYFMTAAIIIMVIIPSAYSFLLFRRESTRPGYPDKEN